MSVRQGGGGTTAGSAVVVICIKVNLAAVTAHLVAVRPADQAGFDVTLPARTAVLRVAQVAAEPAFSAVFGIRVEINTVVGGEDPALGETVTARAR